MRVTPHRYAVDGWGVGELWIAGSVVLEHEAPSLRADLSAPGAVVDSVSAPVRAPKGAAGPPADTLAGKSSATRDPFATDLLRRLEAFFRGERVAFGDVAVDLEWCTPFQREVAQALRQVPWGQVVTYGELAALAGYPNAQRAAGTFCAGNRLSLLVPCHRVVSADGIGSYGSSGVGYKRRLLALEGVEL
jgi:methylated-DNA-[protein]-cysteine S-methyltransferase